jgi:hypothetical protein
MPGDAVVGPDVALWFTEQAGNKIGRFTPLSNTPLLASILPSSRSPEVPHAATAFATIINSGSSAATGCAIAPLQYVPVSSFQYQTTNPATNALTGTVNTPANIPAGQFQTYVIALTPSAPFPPIDLQFSFSCANANAAPIFLGIDTLQYSSSSTAVPDVVALAATARNDGILHIAGIFGSSAFAVATVNVGAAGASRRPRIPERRPSRWPSQYARPIPRPARACQLPRRVNTSINANATPTFAVFATASGGVSFDPANNRIFVQFSGGGILPQTNRIFVQFGDANGIVRGSTSVAVETQ